jgi:hypothetical protein
MKDSKVPELQRKFERENGGRCPPRGQAPQCPRGYRLTHYPHGRYQRNPSLAWYGSWNDPSVVRDRQAEERYKRENHRYVDDNDRYEAYWTRMNNFIRTNLNHELRKIWANECTNNGGSSTGDILGREVAAASRWKHWLANFREHPFDRSNVFWNNACRFVSTFIRSNASNRKFGRNESDQS